MLGGLVWLYKVILLIMCKHWDTTIKSLNTAYFSSYAIVYSAMLGAVFGVYVVGVG